MRLYPDSVDKQKTNGNLGPAACCPKQPRHSSNVQVIGEVIPETDVSLLGLTTTVLLYAEYLCEVTGPNTAATWNPDDAGSVLTENVISGVHVAETTASGP